MLNRETIVKAFNAKCNKRVKVNDESVINSFLDMELFDNITDEVMLELIERGLITTKSELVDRDRINSMWQWCKEHPREEEVEVIEDPETVEEPEVIEEQAEEVEELNEEELFEAPSGGLMGGFEQAIMGMVMSVLKKVVPKMLDERFGAYQKEHPSVVQQTIEYVNPKTGGKVAGAHAEFPNIVTVLECHDAIGRYPLLIGPAGSGKNYICMQIAEYLGVDFYFSSAVTQEYKLTGFIDAMGKYHETQFYKAFKDGGLFMLDELDASDPEVLVTFNEALANGHMDFPIGRVDAHPDFKVIAAANTWGTGADMQYVGRNQIDDATRNRFVPMIIDYDTEVERTLTDDESLIDFIHCFRGACQQYGIHHIASYRNIKTLNTLCNPLGYEKSMEIGLVDNLERDDMMMMLDALPTNNVWTDAFRSVANAR